ncbi:ABC transporter ATP-binding protein [Allorhizobium sonneratiae]|uniref:ABC transporter ATP-binding protein n=1 Tax=Allorhizobium sonneratiae TaxID=2934936 RepID=UPI00237C850F|nr:oligopeptide/dipeptide ABC transporter ATP-binding protein [Allorhizobium sonneratiae]
MMSNLLLKAEDVQVSYAIRQNKLLGGGEPLRLKAVNGVDFTLKQGETLGIVGESGCGKSTLARAIIRLVEAQGRVTWQNGTDLLSLSPGRMLAYRADIQMIFQDPLASLNPRMTVGQSIAEPLKTHRKDLSRREIRARVEEMMVRVGLLPDQINRYPHEFSGGQCQRIGIARALIVEPKLIICDEPVSALDVSIQAQIINLLMDLQQEKGLALLFIAHDLSVVKHISTEVMVLYLGRVMEIAPRDSLYARPLHPYTQALMAAAPVPDPAIERAKTTLPIIGELPSPLNPPSGCVFRTRCPKAAAVCAEEAPPLSASLNGDQHKVACHFPEKSEA